MIAWTILGGILLITLCYLAFLVLVTTVEARSSQSIRCPDNLQRAFVRVEPRRAVLSVFTGADQKVRECSRWPKKAGCDQACKSQLHP